MDYNNFNIYNENAEHPEGDYWKFLNADAKTIVKSNITFQNFWKIINSINNNELKEKMKSKIFELIIENGIFYNNAFLCFNIFDTKELKIILEKQITLTLNNYKNSLENKDNIFFIVGNLQECKDNNWEYEMIVNICNEIKNNSLMLIKILEYYFNNKYIYNKLINSFYNYLPEQYKNLLKFRDDSNYINNKSLDFLDIDLDIGIDPNISIGLEIEANNDYPIKLDLINQKGYENYTVITEPTVPNGDEIKTIKPIYNQKRDIINFCRLCEALKDIGYYYNENSKNASGQINLGLNYLDSKEAILIFYEIYCNCEELLYYIGSEEGQLFRQEVYSSSRIKPISEIIGKQILDEDLSREDVIKLFNSHSGINKDTFRGLQHKKNSVCLRGSNEEDFRLEFRIPNGGCNYKTWIENIRLFGKMMEISKKIADIIKKETLTPEEEKLLHLKIDLENNNLSFEEKLIILMNLLFKDDNIKEIYYNRYKATIKKIRETNAQNYINNNPCEPNFDEVEFIGKYQSSFDLDYNGDRIFIEYDPETDTINTNIKK